MDIVCSQVAIIAETNNNKAKKMKYFNDKFMATAPCIQRFWNSDVSDTDPAIAFATVRSANREECGLYFTQSGQFSSIPIDRWKEFCTLLVPMALVRIRMQTRAYTQSHRHNTHTHTQIPNISLRHTCKLLFIAGTILFFNGTIKLWFILHHFSCIYYAVGVCCCSFVIVVFFVAAPHIKKKNRNSIEIFKVSLELLWRILSSFYDNDMNNYEKLSKK